MEIERTLNRYKADKFGYYNSGDEAVIGFQMHGRAIKFTLPLPDREPFRTRLVRGYRTPSTPDQAQKAWEQACRQRWRALSLVIKAKLEAVECGITLFEEEFLAHIVLPDGKTVGEHTLPMIEQAYSTGKTPALLPFFGGGHQ